MLRHYKDVLPNGLRVVTVEAPQLHAAMLAVYVRAGSRHESPQDNGVSHFLEHLFFRGCEAHPDGRRMNILVEDSGGSLNGVTTRDHGYYFTPVHPGGLPIALDVLGAMLSRPLLKEIDIEREVILEEMLDEVDEAGQDIDVDNLSKRAAYGVHPLAQKIAGTRDTVRAIDRAALERHHARFYVARNMVVTVAGPVKHAQVVELVSRAFGHFPSGEVVEEGPPPGWIGGPLLSEVRHEESQTEFRLSFPAPHELHPDYPAMLLLRRVLDDGLSSRLQVNVVDRRGLAYSVSAGIDGYADTASFELDAACAHRKVPAACEEILRTLGELVSDPVPDDELARVKLRHRMGLEFSLDSAGELAGWFGGTELFHPPEDYETRIRRVDAVTAADVQRVAREIFRRQQLLVTAVGHMDRSTRKALENVVAGASPLSA